MTAMGDVKDVEDSRTSFRASFYLYDHTIVSLRNSLSVREYIWRFRPMRSQAVLGRRKLTYPHDLSMVLF